MLDIVKDESRAITRPDGDGVGVRSVEGAKTRSPTPSSRKFGTRTARGGGDDKVKRKLERALEEARDGSGERKKGERSCCAAVRRARTVAEITPTKVRVTRRIAKPPTPVAERSVAVLHATPRPLDDVVATSSPPSPPPKPCRRLGAFCKVYERLMLAAWRRQRERLEKTVRKCEKYQKQVGQLEVQVDFLKTMRTSECEKRDEALHECQLLRKKNDIFENENSHLIEEVKITREDLANVKINLELVKCDLKRSSEQVAKLQDQLKKKKEEKLDLLSKLSAHEQEIACQTSSIKGLKEKLKLTEMNLHNSEANLNNKQDALAEMIQHFRTEVELNNCLKEEIAVLKSTETDLQNRSRHLLERLEDYSSRCEELEEENESVRKELLNMSLELIEEKKKWYRNTRDFVTCSLGALGKVARAFLTPTYREY